MTTQTRAAPLFAVSLRHGPPDAWQPFATTAEAVVPVKKGKREMVPPEPARSVLIVEDFDDAREMYAEYLRLSGFRVLEARDGLEAIALASRFSPDLIVMDLSLPRLDGWEATRRIKGDPLTSRAPIIALTAYSDPESHARALAAGCLTVCPKPCDPDQLVTTISSVLDGAAA